MAVAIRRVPLTPILGVLSALVLLTFISWRVGKPMAAMEAGVSSLHCFKVRTPITPLLSFVLLPPLLHESVDCMVHLPSTSSKGGSTFINCATNTAVHDPLSPDAMEIPPPLVPALPAVALYRCHPRHGHEPRRRRNLGVTEDGRRRLRRAGCCRPTRAGAPACPVNGVRGASLLPRQSMSSCQSPSSSSCHQAWASHLQPAAAWIRWTALRIRALGFWFGACRRCRRRRLIRDEGSGEIRCGHCPPWWTPLAVTWSSPINMWACPLSAGWHARKIRGHHGSVRLWPAMHAMFSLIFMMTHNVSQEDPWTPQTQQVYLVCQYALLNFYRHGSGETAICVRVDRQRQLMQVLRFDIDSSRSNFLSPVMHLSYLRLKTTILEDTGRSDSRGERRLCYRSARARTLDASIVATSRGSYDPNGPCAPDGSITRVYRKTSTVDFTCLCSVIWEFISHTGELRIER